MDTPGMGEVPWVREVQCPNEKSYLRGEEHGILQDLNIPSPNSIEWRVGTGEEILMVPSWSDPFLNPEIVECIFMHFQMMKFLKL